MDDPTFAALYPIGEYDTDRIRQEVEGRLAVLRQAGADVWVGEPVSDVEGARQALPPGQDRTPDLTVLIPLRGLSAQAIETAARLSPAPCLIWPIQGRYALPSSTLAVGALREAEKPVELLYLPPDHAAAGERVRCTVRAARAYSRLRRSRIGVIGGLFPNLVACRYDPQVVTSRLGAALIPIPYEELRAAMRSFSERMEEVQPVRQDITALYPVEAQDVPALEKGLLLHQALKQVAREHALEAFATECWTGFPGEVGLNPCLGFVEEAYTLACEGDVMLCAGLLIARYLTGASAWAGDVYDLDLEGVLTLVHCGAPASLAAHPGDVVLAKSQLALQKGFQTLTCRPHLQPGPVTLVRLYGHGCDKMHLAVGEIMSSQTSPDLAVKVRLGGNRWDFLEQCFGNHYVVVAGDIRSELRQLDTWLGIQLFET
jgi:L-fucose isomerase-like protein